MYVDGPDDSWNLGIDESNCERLKLREFILNEREQEWPRAHMLMTINDRQVVCI